MTGKMPLLEKNIAEHQQMIGHLAALAPLIEQALERLCTTLEAGGKVMFCGNGGSAADSQHMAAELAGRFCRDRPPLAAIALSSDTSVLTCIGNDYTYSRIFSRQLEAIGREGDTLVAISTSGNSDNVIEAARTARSMGIAVIALTGRNGGIVAGESDIAIVVPSQTTARIQEGHILLGHTLCEGIEQRLFGNDMAY